MTIFSVTAAVAGVLMSPIAAMAAGSVEVSPDGVSYYSSYPGAIFDDISVLAPGDAQQKVFYLRNSGTEAGLLRITLSDVVSNDSDFSQALTLAARTQGNNGSPASLLAANPCWVLLEGQVVAPGATVAVTADMLLDDLNGQAGQGASASMSITVALSDIAAGTLPLTSCGIGGVTVPVVPPSGQTPPAAGPGASGGQGAGGASGTGVELPDESAGGDLPVLNLPGGFVIDPNTWHLYEELLVLVLIAAFILGSGWFMIVAWRHRRNTDEERESDVIA